MRNKEKENEKEIDLRKKNNCPSFIEWPNVWWVETSLIEFSVAVLYKDDMGVEGNQMNSRLLFQFLFYHGLFVYCVAAWGFLCLELHGIKERISAVMVMIVALGCVCV